MALGVHLFAALYALISAARVENRKDVARRLSREATPSGAAHAAPVARRAEESAATRFCDSDGQMLGPGRPDTLMHTRLEGQIYCRRGNAVGPGSCSRRAW